MNSLQFRDGTLTAQQAAALGAASADGIPLLPSISSSPPTLTATFANAGLTISWDSNATGFTLESTDNLNNPTWTAVSGISNNSVLVNPGSGMRFYRLRK